jgi:hypothetical protein
MNTLDLIKKYGLSIRQIPTEVVSIHNPVNRQEDDEEIFWNNRKMLRRTRTPLHPGYWMCQVVANTNSNVCWSHAQCNLAPTLEESVAKFVESLS